MPRLDRGIFFPVKRSGVFRNLFYFTRNTENLSTGFLTTIDNYRISMLQC